MNDALEQDAAEGEVIVECELDAPPEKVWRALTVPELVGEWLEVEPAGSLRRKAEDPTYEIVEALPFSRVRYAWSDRAADEPETFVTFDLAPRPDGRTWFRLTHSVEAIAGPVPAAANSNGRPRMALAA